MFSKGEYLRLSETPEVIVLTRKRMGDPVITMVNVNSLNSIKTKCKTKGAFLIMALHLSQVYLTIGC